MKLTISTFVLSFALATLSEAKIATFTYSGVISSKGGINCSGRIGVSVTTRVKEDLLAGSETVTYHARSHDQITTR